MKLESISFAETSKRETTAGVSFKTKAVTSACSSFTSIRASHQQSTGPFAVIRGTGLSNLRKDSFSLLVRSEKDTM